MRHLLLLALCVGSAVAQWPVDPGQNLSIVSRAGEQTLPKVAPTSDGGCYVSWQDLGSGNYDTWLQRLDAEGRPQWDDGLLVSEHPQDTWITDYDLAVDLDDHAIVAINDIRGGSDRDITAYRISPQGDFVWGADGLAVSANEGFEPDPQILVTTDGNVVFGWQEDLVLHLRKVDRDGVDMWEGGTLTLTHTYSLSIPRLAQAPDDGVLLQYLVSTGSQFWQPKHLYVQRFDRSGTPAWAGLGIGIQTAGGFGLQMRPDLVGDGAGGCWSFWYDSRNNQLHAYAQHLLADGNPAWTANGVLLSENSSELQDQPKLVVDEAGDGAAAIELYYRITDLNQNQIGIAGQRLDTAGQREWGSQGRVLHALSSHDRNSVIAVRGTADSTLVGHLSFPQDVVNSQLVVEAVANNGDAGWTEGPVLASSTPSSRGYLTAAPAANGALLAVWRDTRDDTSGDILLQNVNPDGSLGPLEDTALPAVRPRDLELVQAYPNPFNPLLNIQITLTQPGPLTLRVVDLQGREVARLAQGEWPAGRHAFQWQGEGHPSGLYLLQVDAAQGRECRRVVLLK